MNESLTPEVISHLLKEQGLKQKDLGPILDLTPQQLSNMMGGNRKISASEDKLLRLYFYGEIPFDMMNESDSLESVLNFTRQEWQVIHILAKRAGMKEAKDWIISQIKSYIHHNPEAQEVRSSLSDTKEDSHAENQVSYIEYPFMGAVAAGQPVEAPRRETLTVPSILDLDSHIIIEINGESAEPSFPDGSRWLVCTENQGYTAKKGVPAVFRDSQGTYIKIFNGKDKSFTSVNPNFPDVLPDESLELIGYPVERVDDIDQKGLPITSRAHVTDMKTAVVPKGTTKKTVKKKTPSKHRKT